MAPRWVRGWTTRYPERCPARSRPAQSATGTARRSVAPRVPRTARQTRSAAGSGWGIPQGTGLAGPMVLLMLRATRSEGPRMPVARRTGPPKGRSWVPTTVPGSGPRMGPRWVWPTRAARSRARRSEAACVGSVVGAAVTSGVGSGVTTGPGGDLRCRLGRRPLGGLRRWLRCRLGRWPLGGLRRWLRGRLGRCAARVGSGVGSGVGFSVGRGRRLRGRLRCRLWRRQFRRLFRRLRFWRGLLGRLRRGLLGRLRRRSVHAVAVDGDLQGVHARTCRGALVRCIRGDLGVDGQRLAASPELERRLPTGRTDIPECRGFATGRAAIHPPAVADAGKVVLVGRDDDPIFHGLDTHEHRLRAALVSSVQRRSNVALRRGALAKVGEEVVLRGVPVLGAPVDVDAGVPQLVHRRRSSGHEYGNVAREHDQCQGSHHRQHDGVAGCWAMGTGHGANLCRRRSDWGAHPAQTGVVLCAPNARQGDANPRTPQPAPVEHDFGPYLGPARASQSSKTAGRAAPRPRRRGRLAP